MFKTINKQTPGRPAEQGLFKPFNPGYGLRDKLNNQ